MNKFSVVGEAGYHSTKSRSANKNFENDAERNHHAGSRTCKTAKDRLKQGNSRNDKSIERERKSRERTLTVNSKSREKHYTGEEFKFDLHSILN